jgi:MoxR-like ATPase
MLDVLDQMEFDISEIDKTVTARHRPVIIITSNSKKDLSDPFLGRCNFHHIAFPDKELMHEIVSVHFPDLDAKLAEHAIEEFYSLRELEDIEKRPATRELINWIRAMSLDSSGNTAELIAGRVPYLGILFKRSEDLKRARTAAGA